MRVIVEKDKLNAVELAKTKVSSDVQKAAAAKDTEIKELQAKLEASGVTQKLAVTEALSVVEKERDTLANELDQAKKDNQAALKLAEEKLSNEVQATAAKKDAEIQELKSKLGENEVAQKLAVTEAVSAVEKERDELKNGLKQAELEKQLSEKSLKDRYETQIKDREDEIGRLRDMKARLSTKMVGWLVRTLNNTVRQNLIVFERLHFRELILRRITMQAPVVKVATYSATRMKLVQKSYRSCLK